MLYELQNDGKGGGMELMELKKRKLLSCTKASEASTVSHKKKRDKLRERNALKYRGLLFDL